MLNPFQSPNLAEQPHLPKRLRLGRICLLVATGTCVVSWLALVRAFGDILNDMINEPPRIDYFSARISVVMGSLTVVPATVSALDSRRPWYVTVGLVLAVLGPGLSSFYAMMLCLNAP